jgi:hypothetical protein
MGISGRFSPITILIRQNNQKMSINEKFGLNFADNPRSAAFLEADLFRYSYFSTS